MKQKQTKQNMTKQTGKKSIKKLKKHIQMQRHTHTQRDKSHKRQQETIIGM